MMNKWNTINNDISTKTVTTFEKTKKIKPTSDEVCKALSEYYKNNNGIITIDENSILLENDIYHCLEISYSKKKCVKIFVELPPYLIIMIGRFYE